jgi:hypothetical protein
MVLYLQAPSLVHVDPARFSRCKSRPRANSLGHPNLFRRGAVSKRTVLPVEASSLATCSSLPGLPRAHPRTICPESFNKTVNMNQIGHHSAGKVSTDLDVEPSSDGKTVLRSGGGCRCIHLSGTFLIVRHRFLLLLSLLMADQRTSRCDEGRFATFAQEIRCDSPTDCSEACQEDRETLLNDEGLLACIYEESYDSETGARVNRESVVAELEKQIDNCEPSLASWVIALIVVGCCVLVVGCLVCLCWRCCCRSRRTSSREPIVNIPPYPPQAQATSTPQPQTPAKTFTGNVTVNVKPPESVFDKVAGFFPDISPI